MEWNEGTSVFTLKPSKHAGTEASRERTVIRGQPGGVQREVLGVGDG